MHIPNCGGLFNLICFLHIPKCGGSTILEYIRKSLCSLDARSNNSKTVVVYGSTTWGDYNIKKEALPGLKKILPPEYVKAILGHFDYSLLHSYLGHTNTYTYSFSLTRKPLDRMLSNINYIRLKPRHRSFDFFSRLNCDNLYDYFLARGTAEIGDNSTFQIRYLSGLSHAEIINDVNAAINLALRRVQAYKIENSQAAINANISKMDAGAEVKRRNATIDLLRNSSDDEVRSLHTFTIGDFTSSQLIRLEELFQPDLRLWQLSA